MPQRRLQDSTLRFVFVLLPLLAFPLTLTHPRGEGAAGPREVSTTLADKGDMRVAGFAEKSRRQGPLPHHAAGAERSERPMS